MPVAKQRVVYETREHLPRDIVPLSPDVVASYGITYAWVGTDQLKAYLTGDDISRLGSPTLYVDGTAGLAAATVHPQGNGLLLGSAERLLPTDNCTIIVYRRCVDTTARMSTLFSWFGAALYGTNRVAAHVPWSDGTCYFDFGTGTTTSGRVTAPYVKDTEPEVLAFVAGSSASVGRQIWRRGVMIASNTASTMTRPAAAAGEQFSIGTAFTNGDVDSVEYYYLLICDKVLSARQIEDISSNPALIFEPVARRRWLPSPAAAPPTAQAAAARRGALLMRHFRRHQPYATGAWTPARLFEGGNSRGFWLDFTDPTKRLNAEGTQCVSGDYVRTLIPSAGTASNFTTPNNGPLARDGYIDFGFSSEGILKGTTDFFETTGGGAAAFVMFNEPAPSTGKSYVPLDAESSGKQTLSFVWDDAGPYMRYHSHNGGAGGVNYLYDYYTRQAGRRVTHLFTGTPADIASYRNGVYNGNAVKSSTTPDRTAVPFALGAGYGGNAAPGLAPYTGRGYHAIVRDRPLTAAEISSLNDWAAGLP